MGEIMSGIRECPHELVERLARESDPQEIAQIIVKALSEREAERKRLAAFVRTWLEDWGIDLQQTCDSYRDAMVSGRHNGRKIPNDMARKFASEFKERADAVYPLGELLEKDILALFSTAQGSGRTLADATPKSPSRREEG